jgi:Protein of unknown function (DUF2946)
MRPLPPTRSLAAWLALFALTLQMAVSFGHVHLEGIRRIDPARTALTAAGHAAQSLVAPQPANGGDDDDDAYCPICASVYLTANSFVPTAPVLPLPSVSNVVEHFDRSAPVFVVLRRLAFQSRAPPLA